MQEASGTIGYPSTPKGRIHRPLELQGIPGEMHWQRERWWNFETTKLTQSPQNIGDLFNSFAHLVDSNEVL